MHLEGRDGDLEGEEVHGRDDLARNPGGVVYVVRPRLALTWLERDSRAP